MKALKLASLPCRSIRIRLLTELDFLSRLEEQQLRMLDESRVPLGKKITLNGKLDMLVPDWNHPLMEKQLVEMKPQSITVMQ